MTPTEIFMLFLKHGLEPNERLAFMTEIRAKIRTNNKIITRQAFYEAPLTFSEWEKVFVEKIMRNSRYINNSLGHYGYSSNCTSLSSFMKYLLYYIPSIIGNSRKKNRFIGRIEAEIPDKVGYKRYWEARLIKKWHKFLNEYVRNYDKYVDYPSSNTKYKLAKEL